MNRRAIPLIVFVLVSAVLIAGVWLLIEPTYQARAEIRVRPIIPVLVFKTDQNGPIPFYDSFVNTQISVIRSEQVLQRVLDQDEVQDTQWYKESLSNPNEASSQAWHERILAAVRRIRRDRRPHVERLREALSVLPRSETEIIDVSFTDASAEDAETIVDAVLEQYMQYIGEATNATEDRLYRQLTDQYKSLENEIQGREKICAELHRKLGAEEPQDLISIKRARMDEMKDHLRSAQNRITILESEEQRLAAEQTADAVALPRDARERQRRYHEDAEWRQRDVSVRTLQHEIHASEVAPDHPDVVRAHKDLEFARELLQLRESQLDEQWRHEAATAARGDLSLEAQLARARQEQELLREALEDEREEFDLLFTTAQLLEKEHRALQHKKGLFHAVRTRLDQMKVERGVPDPIEVLTWAFAPSEPTDHRLAFTGAALVAGLVAALIAALVTAVIARKRRPR